MDFSDWMQRFAYRPFIVKTVQFLRMRAFLRWVYYLLVSPRGKIKQISFSGIDAQFYVATPLELRLIETPFNEGMGDERFFLNKILSELKVGRVAYDIGASVGIHTVFMAKKLGQEGKVIAFEPDLMSYACLRANVELNSLRNVVLMNIALGNSFEEGMLYSGGGTADFSLIGHVRKKTSSKVSIIPGDFVVRNNNLPLPHIVKIDVEGYEYHVIEGLEETLKQEICEAVYLEVHPALMPKRIKPHNVMDLLKSFGFKFIHTRPRGKIFHAFCYKC